MIPATTTIAHHHQHSQQEQQHLQQPHVNIIPHSQPQQINPITIEPQQQLHHHSQQLQHIQQHQHQQLQEVQQHQQLEAVEIQNIVTTTSSATSSSSSPSSLPQTINLLGLRNVQITEQQPLQQQQSSLSTTTKTLTPLVSRIKYSRGKIITTTAQPCVTNAANVQIIESHDSSSQSHELIEKYEISEIDLNNTTASAAIISDLVKYAEIDDIELPDGTKIGIGFAPTEITEEQLQTAVEQQHHQQQEQQQHHNQQPQQHQHHQQQQEEQQQEQQQQQQHQQHHHQEAQLHIFDARSLRELKDHDEATTSVEDEAILPDGGLTVQDQPLTKSYTILTTRPLKKELSGSAIALSGIDPGENSNTTTYELSLSDSSLHPDDTKYICRHCGKKYRWKSTLRRHENVECGGKEPCHPCPYCSYKAKQRGNLGVHVRKHHPDKPQLESKRGRKM